ncbi:SDR family NAD(P)-dependent oxidoreductase [Paenibacillus terreus]|uniref:SDR family NAD(P)-dependent oxidoreductase n=1 Tax=Paenibacillus terreus TaxID=1387834 RepID=A0ABV5BEQ6_9BACL
MAITDDETGIAPLLAHKLKAQGIQAEVVGKVPKHASGVVFLGGLRSLTAESEALAVNYEAFAAAKSVAQQLTARGGLFVTVQSTDGAFGLRGMELQQAWTSGLSGLVKTAALEWPKASVKAIDMEMGGFTKEQAADAIMAELIWGGPEVEVGLQGNGPRVTVHAEPASLPQSASMRVLNNKGVIIVTGGARGVTAAALKALAETVSLRFVLLGRTALTEEPAIFTHASTEAELRQILFDSYKAKGQKITPGELSTRVQALLANREIKETLHTLNQLGSHASYYAVDIQDQQALAHTLSEVRREWGQITGIIHGAGVLADKKIADKTPENFDLVFRTKVEGLRNLLAATQKDPLDMIVLFSSIVARTGNIGQCDYAMANEILNKVAAAQASQRGAGCLVKSFNWGAWDGGMVTPSLRTHFTERGVNLIPIEQGARAFVEELLFGDREQIEVVITGDRAGQGLMGGQT